MSEKQVKRIMIQPGDLVGTTFTPDESVDHFYDVWNFDGRWRTDWLGGRANTRSLTGFDRVGVGGYRLDLRITFRNTTPSQGQKLWELFNVIFENPQFPKLFKISPEGETGNGLPDSVLCNIRSGAYGIRRELTVGRQAINVQFTGLHRLNEIPENYVIAAE